MRNDKEDKMLPKSSKISTNMHQRSQEKVPRIVLKKLSAETLNSYEAQEGYERNTRKRKRDVDGASLAEVNAHDNLQQTEKKLPQKKPPKEYADSNASSQRKPKSTRKSCKLRENAESSEGLSKTDLYKVLEVERSAPIQEIKANFYRLARIHHPDRVDDAQKEIAKEKFNLLHQAYSILSNPDTKTRYDDGDLRILFEKTSDKWKHFMRIIDSKDIELARQKYQGTEAEESDIVREIVIGKGSITHLNNVLPFMRFEDEPRIVQLIKRSIALGKIPNISIRKMRH